MAWTAPRTWVSGEVMTSALLNTHVRDNLLALNSDVGSFKTDSASFFGFTDWQNVVFQNSWAQYPSQLPPTMYKKVGSWVFVMGAIHSGTLGNTAFTLPVGYRPTKDVMVFGAGEDSLGFIQQGMSEVLTDGSFVPTFGDAFFFQIAGSFSVL